MASSLVVGGYLELAWVLALSSLGAKEVGCSACSAKACWAMAGVCWKGLLQARHIIDVVQAADAPEDASAWLKVWQHLARLLLVPLERAQFVGSFGWQFSSWADLEAASQSLQPSRSDLSLFQTLARQHDEQFGQDDLASEYYKFQQRVVRELCVASVPLTFRWHTRKPESNGAMVSEVCNVQFQMPAFPSLRLRLCLKQWPNSDANVDDGFVQLKGEVLEQGQTSTTSGRILHLMAVSIDPGPKLVMTTVARKTKDSASGAWMWEHHGCDKLPRHSRDATATLRLLLSLRTAPSAWLPEIMMAESESSPSEGSSNASSSS